MPNCSRHESKACKQPARRAFVHRSRSSGEFIIETPFVLAIIFFLLFFPMLNLVASTARLYCLRQACMEAVHRACKMQSYINDIPADAYGPFSLSANHMAQNSLNQFLTAGYLGGSTVVIPKTLTCIRVPIAGGAPNEYNPTPTANGSPLPAIDVNTFNYQYYLEIRTTVTALPLVPMNIGVMNIPGLTGPIQTNVAYRQMVEHPDGLKI